MYRCIVKPDSRRTCDSVFDLMPMKLVIQGLVLSFFCCLFLQCQKRRLETGVIIVGAGISGIAAAERLRERGVDVLVVEARDRVGGRIHSDRSAAGRVFEIGAGWIEGTEDNPLVSLAEKLSLRTKSDDGGAEVFFDASGRRLSVAEAGRIKKRFEDFSDYVDQTRADTSVDVPLADAVRSFGASASLTSSEKQALQFSLATEIEADYVGDTSELSLLHFDSDRGHGDESLTLNKGYDEIVSKLAKNIDVRLNERVNLIDSSGDGVTVESTHLRVHARYAIITVPLGVLKANAIQFKPELPERKRRAINALKMGTLHRTYFIFPKAFWPDDVHTFYQISDWPAFINMQFYNGQPALLAFHGGNAGRRLDAMDDKDIAKEGLVELRKIFGEKVTSPVRVLASHWGKDPLSQGTYSFIPVGATPEDYDAMAEPVAGKLFFAGEATNRKDPATVHGAYLSGRREARRILRDHYR